MLGSDKTVATNQLYQNKQNKKKNSKAVYRELLDAEKSLLLNFQFGEVHDFHEHYNEPRLAKTKSLSFYEKKQLKQNYLQGNFRFFVNPDYEENITYADPDKEIKWKIIEKVKHNYLQQLTSEACPICLNNHYEMMFPKITRCGHIFCWPCVLKYLSYNKSKCPLCDDFLMQEDLRTVQIVYYSVIKPGEKVHLKLKKRRKSENTVYNAEDFTEEEDFIRIKKIVWDDILKIREEEAKALIDFISILESEGDKESKPYLEQALHALGSSIEKIQKLNIQSKQKRHKASEEEEHKAHEVSNEEEFLYFYQDINGLNLFLHPINNKYIKLQYNDTKHFPLLLEAPLIESRGFQQTEITQRRYKFLNHIPLNSDINFVEIDMKGLLSKEHQTELDEEVMKHYKETSNYKKEALNKALANQQPSKKVSVPTEGKYKIEFPMSPSGLHLNDTQDYPELPVMTRAVSAVTENGWQEKIPAKKKGQGSKKNNPQIGDGMKIEKSLSSPPDQKEEQNKEQKQGGIASGNQQEDIWMVVKPDKYFINSQKKQPDANKGPKRINETNQEKLEAQKKKNQRIEAIFLQKCSVQIQEPDCCKRRYMGTFKPKSPINKSKSQDSDSSGSINLF